MSAVSMIILPSDEIIPARAELCARLRIPPSGEFPDAVAGALCNIRRHAECKAAFVGCDFVRGDGDVTVFPFGEAKSRSLAKFLAPCTSAVLFAATLGMGVERYLCSLESSGAANVFFADAAASAFIEAVCDRAEEMISERFGNVTGRFSPGYGDLSLDIQAPLLSALNAGRMLGVTLTDSMLMIPRKTVSAIIGVKNDW